MPRRLGLVDATTVGLGAMLGAGVFVAFGPAAAAAGAALPLALALAGVVAWLNASSTARLAATHPTAGGAYTYGRARLSPAWGTLAGAAFLVGKTLSTGAIAWAVGTYLWPDHARAVAVAAVVGLTAAACGGLRRSARATTVVVALVLGTLAAVVLRAAVAPSTGAEAELTVAIDGGPGGVLRGAGILFFAFAGYARLATLGEEVRDPTRTIPRAVTTALVLVLATYAAVGAAVWTALGPERLAESVRPVADTAELLAGPGWATVVGVVAALAALTSALGVLLGLSRTTVAMARDGVLPRSLAGLHGPAASARPVRAQILVGGAVVVGLLLVDLDTAIVLSSASVLVYYAVAHLAAWTLPGTRGRAVAGTGLVGCLVVAAALLIT